MTQRLGQKRCKVCSQEKNISAFEKSSKTGYRNTCRKCRRLGKGERLTFICPICEKTFERSSHYLQEIKKQGYKEAYCSRGCRRTGSRKITEADYQNILVLYNLGEPATEIAIRYKVTPPVILRVLTKLNINPRRSYEYIKSGKRLHPTAGKGHTKEAVEKIRQANARQFSTQEARDQAASRQAKAIADGKFAVVSQIEKTVESVLQSLGISFKAQSLIRDPQTHRFLACVDFELDDKVVVEVNGTYWHSDPRFYPNGPIHKSQVHGHKTYTKKVRGLLELGYRITEIWEYDIQIDPTKAVTDALQKIGW